MEMTLDEIRKNKPEGATHYDKFGNYYKKKAIIYWYQFDRWVMMTHSPQYELKPLY